MEEVMPMEIVKNNFKVSILRLTPLFKREFVSFYEALTSYGNMMLIVEEFFSPPFSQNDPKDSKQMDFKSIENRNKLLKSQDIVAPLIYEQQIKRVRQGYFTCLTLTEPIFISKKEDLSHSNTISKYENLVECAFRIEMTQFQYGADCYLFDTFVTSHYTDRVYLDFTRIQRRECSSKETGGDETSNFNTFKKELCNIISAPRQGKISEIIFIKEKSVMLNPSALIASANWVDLALMFNLMQNQKVTVLSDKKNKISPISKLQGLVSIEYKGSKYLNLLYQQGFRMDGFVESTYDQLATCFFEEKATYFMSKHHYQSVKKGFNAEQCWIKKEIEYTDLIIVKSQISKAEFISFLIGYFRYTEPVISAVRFIVEENALQLEFVNRDKKNKSVLIKFSSKYVVKDEEIAMIIEKGKLKNTCLDMKKMQITDSCLMFLANCDKMLNIVTLDISHCPLVTDSGVQLLFASPLCKKMQSLHMAGLVCPDFTVVKFKKDLLQLQINNCQHFGQQFSISDWSLQKLSALGVTVNLNLPLSLKHLTIDQQLLLQNLKYLKNLSLTHLKVKLIEGKKNISNFFNTLTMKENPVRAFCQGRSKGTLKHLDISSSTVKLKEIKSILMMEALESLICEDMSRDCLGDITLPQNIVDISLKGSRISSEQLSEFLCRTSIIIKLNLFGTDIDDNSLQAFARSKKYINDLEISQDQFTYSMLQQRNGIQALHLHLLKLIRDEHELMLNKLLLMQAETGKQINFICDSKVQEKLMGKIHRFSMFYQNQLKKIVSSNLNVFINAIPLWKLISYQAKESHVEHINIVNDHYHKVKVEPSQIMVGLGLRNSEIQMQNFNVLLHRAMTMYRYPLLQVCIRSNRVLGKEVIELIRKYAGNVVKSIDFRDCIFGFLDVKEQLYQYPMLECVNEGEYSIALHEDDICEVQLQKILKFFLKLTMNQKIKLSILAHQVAERQLFYSIMYQIVHQYKDHIVSLTIDFKDMGTDNSELFWMEVFNISHLQVLELTYFNDVILERQILALGGEFKNINNFHLHSLKVATNIPSLMTQNLTILDLKRLQLDFSGETINEANLHKLLKNITSLHHFDLRVANNESLNSLKRLSDVIDKMAHLTHLALNVDSCSIKETQIFQFVYCLQRNKHLERLQLNINNIHLSIPDLVRYCEVLQKQNRYLHIVIYSVQYEIEQHRGKKQTLSRDENELLCKGIEVIQGPSL